jgi:hypothetical protein
MSEATEGRLEAWLALLRAQADVEVRPGLDSAQLERAVAEADRNELGLAMTGGLERAPVGAGAPAGREVSS